MNGRPTTNNPLTITDKQVAEQIMGYDVWPCCTHGNTLNALTGDCGRFRPTSNIAHAWQVVAKMNELGFDVHVNANINRSDDPWQGETSNYVVINNGQIQGSAISESVCVAICKAAISALEWSMNNGQRTD